MISPTLLIPVMLVAFCTMMAAIVSYFTSRIQSDRGILRVVLGALILTFIAALPTLIAGLAPELSADPLRERGKVHASDL
jgi:Ca2+/Na+ antiporter